MKSNKLYNTDNHIVNRGGRLPWVDWAKAIGIFLVVLGHMPGLEGQGLIYMFHMPFFFIISGFLYSHVAFKKEIHKSFRSLIIPYLFFYSILIIIAALLGVFNWNCIVNVLLGNQELLPARFFRPLWFLVSLLIMRLVSSVVNERFYVLLLLGSIVLSLVLIKFNVLQTTYTQDYFQLQTTLVTFPFFILGYFIRKKNWLQSLGKIAFLPLIIIIAVSLIGSVYLGYINGGINVFTCQCGKSFLLYLLVGFVISVDLLCICSLVFKKTNGIIQKISEGTILIIAMHVAFIDAIRYVIHLNNIGMILCACVVMAFCVILEMFFLKYAPALVGRKKH